MFSSSSYTLIKLSFSGAPAGLPLRRLPDASGDPEGMGTRSGSRENTEKHPAVSGPAYNSIETTPVQVVPRLLTADFSFFFSDPPEKRKKRALNDSAPLAEFRGEKSLRSRFFTEF